MHDIRLIREDPAAFDAAMARRGIAGAAAPLLALDEARRAAIHAAETAKAEQNAASKRIGEAKAQGDEAAFERLRTEVAARKAETADQEARARELDAELLEQLMALPNVLARDVPEGSDESDNIEVKHHLTPPHMPHAQEHFDLPVARGEMDFETAAKLSGSRFVLMSGRIARLHRALAQFMLDVHTAENGLVETIPPVLVRDEAMRGTGQLPKFGEDSYRTTDGWWLVPTAEVPLTNIVAGQVIDESDLPRRHVAHTLCFRSEAGSAGKDTAGMLRQHQFEKVEMVSVTHPDASEDEQLRMLTCAEGILDRLELPYRVMKLCDGDTGFGARRTFDIEVWLPGQNRYREISSVSNCWDFQARRMNARYKPSDGGKPQFVHTLNGSGLAVGRTLIAVLENGQLPDGTVELPEALWPYMGGVESLS